jgi:transposase
LRRRKQVLQRVRQILSRLSATGLLEVEVIARTEVQYRHLRRGRPRPGDPVRRISSSRLHLSVTRNLKALRAESRTDGVFSLVTNMAQCSKRQVLEIYKYQPYIEKRFALTKSEYGVMSIFLKKPRRVVALLHVYFVAIMLSALVERQVRGAMRSQKIPTLPILPEYRPTATPTTPRILENFADVAWHEMQEGERTVTFPTELTGTMRLLLDLAEVPETLYR